MVIQIIVIAVIIKKGSFISKIMNYMNGKIYKNAEKIIALGKDMKQVIVNKGIDESKIEGKFRFRFYPLKDFGTVK